MNKQKHEGLSMQLFKVGDNVRATRNINYLPYAYIKEGETGYVTALRPDAPDGPGVDVQWEETHPKLYERQNTTTLIEPETTILELTDVAGVEGRGIIAPAANKVAA